MLSSDRSQIRSLIQRISALDFREREKGRDGRERKRTAGKDGARQRLRGNCTPNEVEES